MELVPTELCGTALNLNPDNLKSLLCFQKPGSASLEREIDACIFRWKFLHPTASSSCKSSVTQLAWPLPSEPGAVAPLLCERNNEYPCRHTRTGLNLQLLRFKLQISRNPAVTASARQAACTVLGPYWIQKGRLRSVNQQGLPCSNTINNEAKCDPALWVAQSHEKASFRISHPLPLLHWTPVIRHLDFGVRISAVLK